MQGLNVLRTSQGHRFIGSLPPATQATSIPTTSCGQPENRVDRNGDYLTFVGGEIYDLERGRVQIQATFGEFLARTAPACWSCVPAPSTTYEPRRSALPDRARSLRDLCGQRSVRGSLREKAPVVGHRCVGQWRRVRVVRPSAIDDFPNRQKLRDFSDPREPIASSSQVQTESWLP